MDTLRLIRERCAVDVSPSDWAKLARFTNPRQAEEVQELFFPGHEGDESRLRAKGFFADLDDDAYDEMYETVRLHPITAFPDIHALLKTSKQDGKTMSVIMAHVGQWLNREPFRVTDRGSNKPPLRQDLLPGLRSRYGDDDAEAKSIDLQGNVLEFVREHVRPLTDPSIAHFLEQFPHDHPAAYVERFEHDPWRGLLAVVYQVCGPHFQGDAMLRFNRQDPSTLTGTHTSAISQGMCHALFRFPEVCRNPALQGKAAEEALCNLIRPMVMRWAMQQCKAALADPDLAWPEPTLRLLRQDLERYQSLARTEQPSNVVEEVERRSDVSLTVRTEMVKTTREAAQRDHSRSPPRAKSDGRDLTSVKGHRASVKTGRRAAPGAIYDLPGEASTDPHTPVSHRISQNDPGPNSNMPSSHARSSSPSAPKSVLGTRRLKIPGGGRKWRQGPGIQLTRFADQSR
jgi:hypothetical protein